MAKNFFSFRYCQTCSGMSVSSCVTSQSSSILQTSSHGPSKNSCSSAVSSAFGTSSNFFQSGSPLNKSPSHQTVPASNASRSVSDISGMTLRYALRIGLVSKFRRTGAKLIGTKITARIVQSTGPTISNTLPIANIATMPTLNNSRLARL